MKKNQQVLLAEKLIAPTLGFQLDMTEKEKKDFLKAMRTMFKLKIKQEIRPEEELMYNPYKAEGTRNEKEKNKTLKKRGVPYGKRRR